MHLHQLLQRSSYLRDLRADLHEQVLLTRCFSRVAGARSCPDRAGARHNEPRLGWHILPTYFRYRFSDHQPPRLS